MINNNFRLHQWYSQLSGGRSFADAKLAFENLQILGPHTGDNYFEAFGAGNILAFADRPFERFVCYEYLLELCKDTDLIKFKQIHKGTPYYFLAWIALEIHDYEKATFYIDAAVAEDIRAEGNNIDRALTRPMGQLLFLRPTNDRGERHVAWRVSQQLRDLVLSELKDFKSNTGVDIKLTNFVDNFITYLIKKDIKNRSIISALYSYVLEFSDRQKMLTLRSEDKGTIEPVIIHLFKGALIFETLLKTIYPKNDSGQIIKTLGDLYKNSGYKSKRYPSLKGLSAKSFRQLLSVIKRTKKIALSSCFKNVTKIRNMTGHSLKWDDIFEDVDNYHRLYKQERNALFYLIKQEFL
jgi:hypothetical protein